MSFFDRLVNLGKGWAATRSRSSTEDERLRAAVERELAERKADAGQTAAQAGPVESQPEPPEAEAPEDAPQDDAEERPPPKRRL